MSYTVEVRATPIDTWNDPGESHVALTTFNGGDRGRMVQVTVGQSYACLTMEQLDDLIEVATFARREGLARHPREGGPVVS